MRNTKKAFRNQALLSAIAVGLLAAACGVSGTKGPGTEPGLDYSGGGNYTAQLNADYAGYSINRGEGTLGIGIRPLAGSLDINSWGPAVQESGSVTYTAPDGRGAIVLAAVEFGIKEHIKVFEPQVDEIELNWELTLDRGLTAKLERDGSLAVYDESGVVQYAMPAPVIYDVAGLEVSADAAHFELFATGNDSVQTLRLVTQGAMLLSYPIDIDPTTFVKAAFLTVQKVGNGSGTVTSVLPATSPINCGADCRVAWDNAVAVGDITLTAAPDAGSAFVKWSASIAGNCAPVTTAAYTCTAQPTGTCNLGAPCTADSECVITTGTAYCMFTPTGYCYGGTGATANTGAFCRVNADCTGAGTPTCAVNNGSAVPGYCSASTCGAGSCTLKVGAYCVKDADCKGNSAGTGTCRLTDCSGTALTTTVGFFASSANQPEARARTCYAQFEPSNYTVTITKIGNPNGAGNITATGTGGPWDCDTIAGPGWTTCAIQAARGTVVTLQPVSADDNLFGGFGGACSGSGQCVVQLTGNRSVDVAFAPVCGDGVVVRGSTVGNVVWPEQCDGSNFDTRCDPATATINIGGVCAADVDCGGAVGSCAAVTAGNGCQFLGFQNGTLSCTNTCLYDTSACSNATFCGDGLVTAPEECDGGVPVGTDCTAFGFTAPGVLACNNALCRWDFAGCWGVTAGEKCGDGVAQGDEQCDHLAGICAGGEREGMPCTLDGECPNSTCRVEVLDTNLATCESIGFEPSGSCTTGSKLGEFCYTDEDCRDVLGGVGICTITNAATGALACHENCVFDVDSCRTCGDGLLSPGEVCDGSLYTKGAATCVNDGATTGAACVIGGAPCANGGTCTLQFRLGLLNGATCYGLGRGTGQLRCKPDCTDYDYSQCTTNGLATAGDNVRQYPETCDGTDLSTISTSLAVPLTQNCQTLGYLGGTLMCLNQAYNTSACCGDGNIRGVCTAVNGAAILGSSCLATADCGGAPGVCTGLQSCDGNLAATANSGINNKTCVNYSGSSTFTAGTLQCMPYCSFDTRLCY